MNKLPFFFQCFTKQEHGKLEKHGKTPIHTRFQSLKMNTLKGEYHYSNIVDIYEAKSMPF